MDLFDKDLQELVAKGKTQGYLTYDEVTRYLPDEAMNPEKLDNLLMALDEQGINLVNEAPETEFLDVFPGGLRRPGSPSGPVDDGPEGGIAEAALRLAPDEVAKWSNDPDPPLPQPDGRDPALVAGGRDRPGQEDRGHPQAVPPHRAGLQPGYAEHGEHPYQGP